MFLIFGRKATNFSKLNLSLREHHPLLNTKKRTADFPKEISVVRFLLFIQILIYSWSSLLNLLEMQTVIKQAICVNVLQMCCKTRANERKENLLSFPSAAEFDLGQLWK